MIFYITVLRCLAACIITNAHYTGVYPTDLIANGGLLGDVIFFAVSGFCLVNIRQSFPKWYGKRLLRVFPATIICTVIGLLVGSWKINSLSEAVKVFLFPTNYRFVGSIVLLYIVYYCIMRIEKLHNHLPAVIAVVAVLQLIAYLFFYDRSYYHIDTVREPMIRFLFLEAMLIGAQFRCKDAVYRNKKIWLPLALSIVVFVLYFASKMFFVKTEEYAYLQILNQYILLILLVLIFRTMAGLDSLLCKLPKSVKCVIEFISSITLEIYLVQIILICIVKSYVTVFPLNWFALTGSILLCAWILHLVVDLLVNRIPKRIGKRRTSA